MKLILITLVAVVVGMMAGCDNKRLSSEDCLLVSDWRDAAQEYYFDINSRDVPEAEWAEEVTDSFYGIAKLTLPSPKSKPESELLPLLALHTSELEEIIWEIAKVGSEVLRVKDQEVREANKTIRMINNLLVQECQLEPLILYESHPKAEGGSKVPTTGPADSQFKQMFDSINKTPTSSVLTFPTPPPKADSGLTYLPLVITPTPERPTVTPDPWVNANLKGRWRDMLASFRETPEGQKRKDCLWRLSSGIMFDGKYYKATYYPLSQNDYWIAEASGNNCRGIESWKIDDDTGRVTYLGSSLDK